MNVPGNRDYFFIRVNEIIEIVLDDPDLLDRRQVGSLRKKIMEKYTCSSRQANRYICGVKEKLVEIRERDMDKALKRALSDREYLLRKAKNERDNKLVLEVMRDRDKLLGLYVERSKTEIQLRSIDMTHFTDLGLERLARGESVTEVMQDPNSYSPNGNKS